MAKLNIGSSVSRGRYRDDEWINLDIRKYRGVDVIGSGFSLPFRDDTFSEVHAIHVLEHLTRDKFPVMLTEIARVCKGYAYIEVPDFKAVVELLYKAYQKEDLKAIHTWRTSIYGKTERPGMAHHFGFDTHTLKEALKTAGFCDIDQLTKEEEMISNHYLQEPVLLMRAKKKII